METLIAPRPAKKKMFGGYCWMLNGNMLAAVEVGRFMLRVGKELEAEALGRPGCSRIVQVGRSMPGFIWIDAETAFADGLKYWTDFAERYVGSLPPKERTPASSRQK